MGTQTPQHLRHMNFASENRGRGLERPQTLNPCTKHVPTVLIHIFQSRSCHHSITPIRELQCVPETPLRSFHVTCHPYTTCVFCVSYTQTSCHHEEPLWQIVLTLCTLEIELTFHYDSPTSACCRVPASHCTTSPRTRSPANLTLRKGP
jgi:hypothetical protein